MHSQAVSMNALGLTPALLRAVSEAGYEEPTPIQRDAIPPALAGRDVLGCAQTGTGKTAAFALPILQRLAATVGEEPTIRALVLTPTRELAAQIGESFATYGKHLDLWHTVIFGGVSQKHQVDELDRGIDILVATPGRLLDLMSQGYVDLRHVEVLVLDEADRMLDMGFLPDVKRIVKQLPAARQTLFFSATMPPAIRSLAERLLRDPVQVSVTPVSSTTELVDQRVVFAEKSQKPALLLTVLRDPAMCRTLVFSRTKHGANRIVTYLERAGVTTAAIHGNKSQAARVRALDGFRTGKLPVLVATDVAARGIDVEGVSHVINYDLPNVPETYVHRIGRTGRAGASGIALSFCGSDERPFLADIEKLIGKRLTRLETPDLPRVAQPSRSTERRPDARRPSRPGPSQRGRGGARGRARSSAHASGR